MKRPLSIFARCLTPLSAVLLLAILVIWVWSYWRCEVIILSTGVSPKKGTGQDVYVMQSMVYRGRFSFSYVHAHAAFGFTRRNTTPTGIQHSSYSEPANHQFNPKRHFGDNRFGFRWLNEFRPNGTSHHRVVLLILPPWFLASIASILPAHWLWRRIHHQTSAGHCPTCGYDLRATPDRCPECGRMGGTKVESPEATL